MPTRPQVTEELGGGDYRVEGMQFQMGGWWTMIFDIEAGGQTRSCDVQPATEVTIDAWMEWPTMGGGRQPAGA
jgi:hypothetical protein